MFGARAPSYERSSGSRRTETSGRPFQRYEMSPIRNSGMSLRLFADDPKSRRDRDDSFNGHDWRGRAQNSPPRKRISISPQRRRSRSRSPRRGRRMMSRSPIRNRYSRSPLNSWRQQSRLSPIRRSPRPVGLPEHNSYRRDRSRSGSNMDIASNGSSPSGFRNTFRPVEQKKTKKIKISVPKDLPRDDSSPDIVEVSYHGYKIRNAPEVNDSKRRSRWDTDQSALHIPNTKEILEQQGVRNPEAALERIANLPTMESQFKSKTDDDDAVKTQLRLLEQQQHFAKIRENLPPSVAMPSSLAFSAIGKSATKNIPSVQPATSVSTLPSVNLTTTIPTVNGAAVSTFAPSNFATPFPMSIPPFQMPNFAAPSQTTAGLPFPMPNFNAPPPMMTGASDVVKFNLTNIGFPPIQEQQMDPTEALFRARADLYRRDLSDIRSIPELMKYMWGQGFDPISPDDPPLLFNEVLKSREGTLGASALYQIICYGHPELETYYCGMCNHWTTVSEMFNHLNASMHRMNFLARNYKLFHKKAEEHQDLAERDKFLDFICKRVWKIDRSGQCVNRMRCILNIDAIKQVWPNYSDFVDNSWKVMASKDGMDSILNSKQVSMLDERPIAHVDHNDTLFPVRSDKEKITIKPSLNSVLSRPIGELERVDDRERYRRSRSKSRDRTRKRSRSRRRSSSRDKRDSRRRSRSRSKSPRRSRVSSKDDWQRKAAQFIHQINSDGIRSTFDSLPASSNNDFDSRNRRREAAESEDEQVRHTRKALAVLIELQQLNSSTTPIKKSMVYAIASEMGMDEEAVRNSKILKQGLGSMNIVDDTVEQKSVSLESLGMSSSDLKKLLSSVANKDEFDMGYPEVGSESKLATSIRAAIRETKQKMNDPKNAQMITELQSRLDHLEVKLSEELGVDPVKRVPSHAMHVRSRPGTQHALPPGAWRNQSTISEQQRAATLRARREQEENTSRVDDNKFDSSKVEKEWTEYYLKDPSKIDDLDKPDKHAEAQYDGYYGPGTYVAFCAAKKRAAMNARKVLGSRF